MVPTTIQPAKIPRRSNDDYDYYVNVVLFGATITCYVVLLFLFGYFVWKVVRSAIRHLRTICMTPGLDDSTVPYKGMKSEELSNIAIIPVAMEKGICVHHAHEHEPVRNPFWGPLHARAEAAAVA